MKPTTAHETGLPHRAVPPHRQLRTAMHDAAVRAPKEPSRTPRPGQRRLRLIGMASLAVLTVGWTAGSIAIPMNVSQPPLGATVAWSLGLAQSAPLVLAVRWPLVAWRVMAVGLLAGVLVMASHDDFWPWPVTSFLSLVVVLFAVAVSYDRGISAGVGVLTVLGLFVPAVVLAGMPGWFGLILAGIVLIALLFGDAVGGLHTAELSLAEQAELRRRDLVRQATLEERARIARELHDVVAHHMSVIAMQAEAAPYKIPDLPPAARDTFVLVRDAARDALAETRRVVGLLRAEDEGAERRPQPGLDRLDEVVAGANRAGLTVVSRIVGLPRSLPAGVELSAYRIVQESLSNAAKYAPGARVEVGVRYARDGLEVEVGDDGARGRPEPSGGGHGIIGMRERVTMLGGTLTAGPRPAGGWQVTARLPYGDPPYAPADRGAGGARSAGDARGGAHP